LFLKGRVVSLVYAATRLLLNSSNFQFKAEKYKQKALKTVNNQARKVTYTVTKGKRWTAQEEAELASFVAANMDVVEIAQKLGKTEGSIFIKCQRLGLRLPSSSGYTDSAISIPKELPSVEEALKMLAGALRAAVKPGLSKVEVQRLQTVATIAKTYQELLSDYINYRQIETKLKEMEEQNARLLKELEKAKQADTGPSVSPQSNSS
jgi:hypothetical protein